VLEKEYDCPLEVRVADDGSCNEQPAPVRLHPPMVA
jgi:hypothetical protein